MIYQNLWFLICMSSNTTNLRPGPSLLQYLNFMSKYKASDASNPSTASGFCHPLRLISAPRRTPSFSRQQGQPGVQAGYCHTQRVRSESVKSSSLYYLLLFMEGSNQYCFPVAWARLERDAAPLCEAEHWSCSCAGL